MSILNNGEYWFLKTNEYTLESLKEHILTNCWIKLSRGGRKEVDIQTCSIISIDEHEDYQKHIDEYNKNKEFRLKIIKQIEKYRFNWRMKLYAWFHWGDVDPEDEHPLLAYNEKFLNTILEKCKKYKCKLL